MVKKICTIGSVLLFVGIVCLSFFLDKSTKSDGFLPTENETLLSIELSPIENNVVLVNSVIEKWLTKEYSARDLHELYREKFGRLDYPTPLTIKFSVIGLSQKEKIVSQIVEISENSSFDSPKIIKVENHKSYATIYNLKTNCKYYFRVSVTTSNNHTATAESSFQTADTPRILMIDGLRNVRDIGGYETVDGKEIKQGLLYRGVELHGTLSKDYKITPAGVDVLVNDLNLKTEMDLRWPENGGATVHGSIKQKYYKCGVLYNEIFTPEGKEIIKTIFSDFAKKESFPAYLHCTYGSDRTGIICYLLQALCGVSEEDCYREWELTVFFRGEEFSEEMQLFINSLNSFRGNTLQEKTETFLLSCGVKRSQINSIKNIFLTD